jgi:hypothetical protein
MTTRKVEEEIDLDDGPVLTSDRLRLAVLPRKAPPPPPPARRARGTAPLGEPVPSGLIDVREMAAAYAAERPAPPLPPVLFAEGTAPLERIEAEPARHARLSRIAVAAGIAAVLGGAAIVAASRLDREVRPETTAAAGFDVPPLVIRAESVFVPAREPPIMRVVPLPTTVTEVAAPEPTLERPALRRPALRRDAASVTAVSMRPSNSEIASAVVAAQRRLDACGARHATSGQVPVTMRVAPSGAIASVTVGLGTTSFRDCVAGALRRQRLPASQVGTTARFPVIVR